MDIYKALKEDHDLHRSLLQKIVDTEGDSEARRKHWRTFYYGIKSHSAAEEESFYSRLMQRTDGQPEARHGVAEHKEMDQIVDELDVMDFSSPGWLTRFKTLKDAYEHHMDEEEDEIFAKARSIFTSDEAAASGATFKKRKQVERRKVDEKAEDKLEE